MNRTKIEWVKNPDGSQGYTWNPVTGCLNNCPYCYARKLAEGRLRSRYLANQNVAYCYYRGKELVGPEELLGKCNYSDPFYPRFWPERLGDLYTDNYPKHGKPKGIFVCDMGELFGDWIPEKWIREVLTQIELYPWHRFYLLTKQPQNLIKFSPFPDNCWVGVTTTSHQMFVNACLLLGDITASVKYLSLEPLLSWGDYPADKTAIEQWAKGLKLYGIKWVIIGAQTKPYKPPEIEWVIEIIQACEKASIPVFMKDNLKPLAGRFDLKQELPK